MKTQLVFATELSQLGSNHLRGRIIERQHRSTLSFSLYSEIKVSKLKLAKFETFETETDFRLKKGLMPKVWIL